MSQSYTTESFAGANAVVGNPVYFKPGMTLKDVEKNVILETLRQQRFNRTRTARVLAIGIRTLQRKLKQYREEAEMQTVQANPVMS